MGKNRYNGLKLLLKAVIIAWCVVAALLCLFWVALWLVY